MEKKKISKKILIVILLLVIVVASAWYLLGRKGLTGSGLSTRAREFVQKQQESGNSQWTGVDLENPNRPGAIKGAQIIEVGKCFSFDLPFPIILRKKMGDCSAWFSIDSPRGQITAYLGKSQLKSLDEDSGVYMRRVNKDKYQEQQKVFNQREFLIFKNTSSGYEANAFYLKENSLFVINLIASTNENLDKKFFQMLESIKFVNLK